MSFYRSIYYSAVIAGWMALAGWTIAELLILPWAKGTLSVVLVSGVIGACIGAGLNVIAGLANGRWMQLVKRMLPGMAAGFVGGAVAGLVAQIGYSIGLPRAVAWTVLGCGIGIVEGLYDRSLTKVRNGLIGGAAGGLLGGILFDAVAGLVHSTSGASARAVGFVILGVCIGVLIGLAQVVLKHAWLTVVDGYRPGRQLILGKTMTVLGRADHLPLPFLGSANHELELEHARVMCNGHGRFVLEDNGTRLGTFLNGKQIAAATPLSDGDTVRLGRNYVRFNERTNQAIIKPTDATKPTHLPVTQAPRPPQRAQAAVSSLSSPKPSLTNPLASQSTSKNAPAPIPQPTSAPRSDLKPKSSGRGDTPFIKPPPPPPRKSQS